MSTDLENRVRQADRFQPGSMGCHEALHMALVISEMVDERLCQHPAIMQNLRWGILAERACRALNELYAEIAKEHATPDGSVL